MRAASTKPKVAKPDIIWKRSIRKRSFGNIGKRSLRHIAKKSLSEKPVGQSIITATVLLLFGLIPSSVVLAAETPTSVPPSATANESTASAIGISSASSAAHSTTAFSNAKQQPVSEFNNPAITNIDYLEIALGLIFVVLVIYGGAWLVKRLNGGIVQSASQMRVLSAISLGVREKLILVDVAGTQLLVGVSPGRVNKVHVFDDPVIDLNKGQGGQDFAHRLKSIMSGSQQDSQKQTSITNTPSKISSLENQGDAKPRDFSQLVNNTSSEGT